LALTEIIKCLIKFELIFGDECFDIDFELILLAFRDVFEALIISLMIVNMCILFVGTFYKCFD